MDYLEYLEDLDIHGFDVEEFLREEQQGERERLERELERIEELLSEREEIHSETVEELESKLDWYVERLEDLYRGIGGAPEEEKQRLKSRIEEFYSEIRSEKRQQWRDRIELEMTLTEVERSLGEIKGEDELWKLLD
jgi:ElaB/YqjD/DUF883 family membrane-anchored ribosome-binding protein